MDALVQDNAPPGMTHLKVVSSPNQGPSHKSDSGGNSKGNIKEIKNKDGDAFRNVGTHQNQKTISIEARGPL